MPSRKASTAILDPELMMKVQMDFDAAFDLLDQLTEDELTELNDEFDPENNLLPICERITYECEKQPSRQFKRSSLKDHLEKVAYESTVGENYLPYVKPIGYKTPDRLVTLKPTPIIPKARAPSPLPDLTDEEKQLIENASEEELVVIAENIKVKHGLDLDISSSMDLLRKALVRPQHSLSIDEEDEYEETIDIDAILKAIRSKDQDVSIIVINNQPYMDPEIIEELAQHILSNKNIRHLSLANCNITDSLVETFAEALEVNTILETLNLESNFISPVGMKLLLDSIAENTTLRELRVENQYSKIGPKCEIEMTDMVKNNYSLLSWGYSFETKGPRDAMAKYILRNNDLLRERRRRGESNYNLPHQKRLIEQYRPPWMIRRLKPKGGVELEGRQFLMKGKSKKKVGAMMSEMFDRAAQVSQRWDDKSKNGGLDQEYKRIEDQSKYMEEESEEDDEDGVNENRNNRKKWDDDELSSKRRMQYDDSSVALPKIGKLARRDQEEEEEEEDEEDDDEDGVNEKRNNRKKWDDDELSSKRRMKYDDSSEMFTKIAKLAGRPKNDMTDEELNLWNSLTDDERKRAREKWERDQGEEEDSGGLRQRRKLKGGAAQDFDDDMEVDQSDAAKRRKREKWERDRFQLLDSLDAGLTEEEMSQEETDIWNSLSDEEKSRSREKWIRDKEEAATRPKRNLAELSEAEMTDEERNLWNSMSLRERRKLKEAAGLDFEEEEKESEEERKRKREKWERTLGGMSEEDMTDEELKIWNSMSDEEKKRSRENWKRYVDEVTKDRNIAGLEESEMTEQERKLWDDMPLRERRRMRKAWEDEQANAIPKRDLGGVAVADMTDEEILRWNKMSREEKRRTREKWERARDEAEQEAAKDEPQRDLGGLSEEEMTKQELKIWNSMSREEKRRSREKWKRDQEEDAKPKRNLAGLSESEMTEEEKTLWNSMSLRERRRMTAKWEEEQATDQPQRNLAGLVEWEMTKKELQIWSSMSPEERKRSREKWERDTANANKAPRNLGGLSVKEMTADEILRWNAMTREEQRQAKEKYKRDEEEAKAALVKPLRDLGGLTVAQMTDEELVVWNKMSLEEKKRSREKWEREKAEANALPKEKPKRNLAELSEEEMTEEEKLIWKAMSLRERRLLKGGGPREIVDDDDFFKKPAKPAKAAAGDEKDAGDKGRRERKREKEVGLTPEEQKRAQRRQDMKNEEERRKKEEEMKIEEARKIEEAKLKPATTIQNLDNMSDSERLLWDSMSLRERRKMKGAQRDVIVDDDPFTPSAPKPAAPTPVAPTPVVVETKEEPKSILTKKPEETQERRRTRDRRQRSEEQPTPPKKSVTIEEPIKVPAKVEEKKPAPTFKSEEPIPEPHLSLRERRKRREMGL